MDTRRDEVERFFQRAIRNAARGGETSIRVQSHSPDDPRWITNAWGSRDVARKRPEEDCDTAEDAARWVLDKKYGRLAIVPSFWNAVVKLADTEAVDLGLEEPIACRLAFFPIVPSLVVAHREAGTLHAVWLSTRTTRPLSDRFARRLKGTPVKRIPVPGTIAHGGYYEFIQSGPDYSSADLVAAVA